MSDTDGEDPATLLPEEVFWRRVDEIRRRRGWTVDDVMTRLEALGFEGATGGLPLNEALAVAVSLGVSPTAVLVPDSGEQLSILPAVTLSAVDALGWIRGYRTSQESSLADIRDEDLPLDALAAGVLEAERIRILSLLAHIAVAIEKGDWRRAARLADLAEQGSGRALLSRVDALLALDEDWPVLDRAIDEAKRFVRQERMREHASSDAGSTGKDGFRAELSARLGTGETDDLGL